jgi:hypothetical protein
MHAGVWEKADVAASIHTTMQAARVAREDFVEPRVFTIQSPLSG